MTIEKTINTNVSTLKNHWQTIDTNGWHVKNHWHSIVPKNLPSPWSTPATSTVWSLMCCWSTEWERASRHTRCCIVIAIVSSLSHRVITQPCIPISPLCSAQLEQMFCKIPPTPSLLLSPSYCLFLPLRSQHNWEKIANAATSWWWESLREAPC